MKTYIGTKIINAKPMTRGAYSVLREWVLPDNVDGRDEGYLVEYIDGGKANHPDFTGYVSWSPKEQFELAYHDTSVSSVDFGGALGALKDGLKVARAGWNGKGLSVCIIRAGNALNHGECMKDCFGLSDGNGSIQPGWVPSTGDCMATDWVVL
jgi:hypothetical protein